MQNGYDKAREVSRILVLILALNLGVALAKIAYGLITNFSSMTADGFHSLSDGVSNIIGLIGISIARRPPDDDHPYGHKKYETLFSFFIAGLLALVCFGLLSEGIKRLNKPVLPDINFFSLAVMLITMAVNLYVMAYEHREGIRLKSDILISDSMHTGADMLTSFAVIAAMVGIKMGCRLIDPVVTITIAFFIAYAAFTILRRGSRVLCDTTAVTDAANIELIVLSVKGVRNCHKIRTRGREDDIHVDLHVQVNPEMHVNKAHEICYRIENEIKDRIPGVTDVVVHVEPKTD